ncbi:MAG: hypothetical protein PHD82_06795 [Candidatus Riflebacteria bacterium]|nr:hypothetical protein [Candidatus Riflebacteria bacterium]
MSFARHFLLANFSVESNALLHNLARKLQQTEGNGGSVPSSFHLTLVYLGAKIAAENGNDKDFSFIPLRQNLRFPEAFKIRGIYRFHSPEGNSAGYSLHLEQCRQLEECVAYLAREASQFFFVHEKQHLNNPHITLLNSESAKNKPTVCLLPEFKLPSALNLDISELELTATGPEGFVSLSRLSLADRVSTAIP